jgi:hypothetical protein
MAKPQRKRPSDPLQLAKLVGDLATGQVVEGTTSPPAPTADEVRRVMSALGKIGGPKGGKARAKSLSAQERARIAKKGAVARWGAIRRKKRV